MPSRWLHERKTEHYYNKAKEEGYNGGVMQNLYQEGAVNNIAEFHRCITQGDFANPTVAPSVRSNLTTILGRTAAYQRQEISWDDMLKKAERWDAGLKGLKA